MFFASLRLPANSCISLNTAPHLPLTLGLTPPLIKDTAEPPGWLVLVRKLVELAEERKNRHLLSSRLLQQIRCHSMSLNNEK
ncbi:MAG TPA: hypothetical protein PLK28_20150, partial [Candidatus Rifleibacterium sp.]|nr:hypothetical protein [Candidatus Rifleibacterium sp.]